MYYWGECDALLGGILCFTEGNVMYYWGECDVYWGECDVLLRGM